VRHFTPIHDDGYWADQLPNAWGRVQQALDVMARAPLCDHGRREYMSACAVSPAAIMCWVCTENHALHHHQEEVGCFECGAGIGYAHLGETFGWDYDGPQGVFKVRFICVWLCLDHYGRVYP
jgi:hypothetical protein